MGVGYGELWEPKPTILRNCVLCGGAGTRRKGGSYGIVRGLCPQCYADTKREGTFEAAALPKSGVPIRPMGSRALSKEGYVTIKTESGIWSEHRVVMEEFLGRGLATFENVHHINGVRHDNRLENLELWFTPQPYGQRVSQLIPYLVEHHRQALLEALGEAA